MKKLLVVDDDDMFRNMLERMLKNAGYEVAVAANGAEALRQQKVEPADLVITDIIMPDMEGIETIRILVKEYPQTRIIAMSGGGSISPDQYLELSSMLGAQKTFAKPFSSADLLQAVKELLGDERATSEP